MAQDIERMHLHSGKVLKDDNTHINIAEYIQKIYEQPTIFWFEVNEGKIEGHVVINISADSSNINTTNTTIRELNDRYVFPTTASTFTVVSSSDEDKPTRSGCPQINMLLLDDNWESFTERIELNGTTPVTTIATNCFRINQGNPEIRPCIGNIDVKWGTNIVARITPEKQITKQGVFSVPYAPGYLIKGYIMSAKFSAVKGCEGTATVFAINRSVDDIYVDQSEARFYQNEVNAYDGFSYDIVNEKGDIEFVAKRTGAVGNASISLRSTIILTIEEL